jgi:hypothetical protein
LAPNTEPDHVGDILLASGWGLDSDSNFPNDFGKKSKRFKFENFIQLKGATSTTANLRKVNAPGISVADCQDVYGNGVLDSVLCIDTTGGHGTCNVRSIFSHLLSTHVYVDFISNLGFISIRVTLAAH